MHRRPGGGQRCSQPVRGLEGPGQEAWGRGARMDTERAPRVKMLAPR